MTRRQFVTTAVAALLTTLVMGGPAGASVAPEAAKAFVARLADKAVAALTDPRAPLTEREVRFRRLLNEYFDVRAIGEWVLGRYWKQATPVEREDYLKLFEEMIVTTYLNRFSNYSGETLRVMGATEDGGDIIVVSAIDRPGAERPLDVGWRVRGYPQGIKIVDTVVEGVSLSQTQRAEFGAVIRRNSGSVAGLLAEMRRLVARNP